MDAKTVWGALFAIGGVATPFVILWCRHRALRYRAVACRTPTNAERISLRRRGRLSIIWFLLFWVSALSLIAAVSILQLSPAVERRVLGMLVLLVVALVAHHLSIRCPVCQYRLGYQRSLGVPARCERCGADL